MSVLENARHERFVQNLRKGMSQRDAYRDAFKWEGDPDSHSVDASASALNDRDDVRERYEELMALDAERAGLKRERIIEMVLETRALAAKLGQTPTMLKAAELLGKEIAGMFVDRREVKTTVLDEMGFQELERIRKELDAEQSRRDAEACPPGSRPEQDSKILPQ